METSSPLSLFRFCMVFTSRVLNPVEAILVMVVGGVPVGEKVDQVASVVPNNKRGVEVHVPR